MTALLPPLLGIALLDSLNPSLFIAQFVLLATPRPTVRIITFIAGLLLVNYLAGLLLFTGAQAVIGQFFTTLPPAAGYLLQAVIGGLLFGFGVYLWRRRQSPPSSGPSRQPRSLHPIATFGFGIIVMINEMTTSLPMFAAVERMTAAGIGLPEAATLLLAYNVVFALPLFGFLIAFLRLRERFTARIDAITQSVQVWALRLTCWFALLAGALLLTNVGWLLVTGKPLLG